MLPIFNGLTIGEWERLLARNPSILAQQAINMDTRDPAFTWLVGKSGEFNKSRLWMFSLEALRALADKIGPVKLLRNYLERLCPACWFPVAMLDTGDAAVQTFFYTAHSTLAAVFNWTSESEFPEDVRRQMTAMLRLIQQFFDMHEMTRLVAVMLAHIASME